MAALFGAEQAADLSTQLDGMSPAARESTIVDALAKALKQNGSRFVLPFCFKNDSGKRTKHHLILVTKHFKGYEVMKDIMAKTSSAEVQGVPTFEYSPADSSAQSLLFELNRPLDDLEEQLLADYAGLTRTMRQIYEDHSVDKRYLSKNYKDVLRKLEDEGRIKTAGRKSTRGFGDEILVTFPRK